jgi:hypothetical protein
VEVIQEKLKANQQNTEAKVDTATSIGQEPMDVYQEKTEAIQERWRPIKK